MTNEDEYSDYTRQVTLILEDVTPQIAAEFFTVGLELDVRLSDGLLYTVAIASVDA